MYVYIHCKLIRNNYECIFIYHKQKKGVTEDFEENVYEFSSPENININKRVIPVIYNRYYFTFFHERNKFYLKLIKIINLWIKLSN